LHRTRVYTNTVHICQDDRITGFQSFSFRASEANLFGALLNGATFFPYDLKEHGSNGLADWLMRHEITIYYAITTAFRQFVATLRGGEEFPRIRLVKIGGETVVQRDVELFKTHFPRQCVFLNNYAPSESGIARWYFVNKDTRNADAIVPIGYRTEGTEAAVLDEAGHEVGFDQMGEIAIRGRYLSPGYWENGDLTDAKFLSSQDGESERIYLTGDLGRMSPDGCLTHLGRKDSQVKIRGYRIELAEIERVLLEIESVREAVVVARNHDNPGNQRLVAYVVPRSGDFLTFSEIRRILGASVPDYLVPSKVVWLDALPLTPTGKVDLVALPEPGEERPDLEQPYAVPRTPVEELLTEMWADVLGMEQVGIHDNFLDLGGDSLSAGRVISRVIDIFGIKISFRTLFDAPTVADMARVILHHDDKTGNQRDV